MIDEIKDLTLNKIIDKIEDVNGVTVYEAWERLTASGVPPITLQKCKGVDLVDYKIYGNSVQNGTPTPETPIEIESVGDKTSNELKPSVVRARMEELGANQSSIKFHDDGGIQFWGSPINGQSIIEGDFEENTAYTFILYGRNINSSAGVNTNLTFEYTDGTKLVMANFSTKNEMTGTTNSYAIRTTDANKTLKRIYAYSSAGYTIFYPEKSGIFKGAVTLDDYKQYGYEISVKVRGKNLINYKNARLRDNYTAGTIDISDDGVVTYNGNYWYSIDVNLKGGKAYVFDCEYENTSDNNPSWYFCYSDGTRYGVGFGKSINVPDDKEIVRVDIYTVVGTNGANKDTLKMWNLQLEENSTPTVYEHYVEPITTNIYLNEPLRKAGEYKDYIDFEQQKVIRELAVYSFKGTESLTLRGSQPNNGTAFMVSSAIVAKIGTSDNSLCSRFEVDRAYSRNMTPNTCGFIDTSVSSRFHFCLEGVGKTTTEAKEIIANWYSEGKPMLVYYPLENPDDTETIELSILPTHKGTTILEVDTTIQPSNMEVEYYGKG